METVFINTPLGIAKIEGDESGLTGVTVFDTDEKISDIVPELLEDAVYQLQEYFEGTRKEFSLTLNPEGTEFQKKVWQALQQIPYGQNPLWIIVPCHRVIGSDGSLTGYAGGLHRKKWLLEHESPVKQQTLF